MSSICSMRRGRWTVHRETTVGSPSMVDVEDELNAQWSIIRRSEKVRILGSCWEGWSSVKWDLKKEAGAVWGMWDKGRG